MHFSWQLKGSPFNMIALNESTHEPVCCLSIRAVQMRGKRKTAVYSFGHIKPNLTQTVSQSGICREMHAFEATQCTFGYFMTSNARNIYSCAMCKTPGELSMVKSTSKIEGCPAFKISAYWPHLPGDNGRIRHSSSLWRLHPM